MGGYRLNRLTLALAIVSVVLDIILFVDLLLTRRLVFPFVLPHLLVRYVPQFWLLGAALLVLRDATPLRYAVLIAVVLTMTMDAFWLGHIVKNGFGNGFGAITATWYSQLFVASQSTPAFLAVTVFLPAVVGWWHRRQDRPADPDSAG